VVADLLFCNSQSLPSVPTVRELNVVLTQCLDTAFLMIVPADLNSLEV
jgi:hypothetical protein